LEVHLEMADLFYEMRLLLLGLNYPVKSQFKRVVDFSYALGVDVLLGALCQHLMLQFLVFTHNEDVVCLITDNLQLKMLLLQPLQLILQTMEVFSALMMIFLQKLLVSSAGSCLIAHYQLLCLLDKGLQLLGTLI
jgi:hypothetical protein